MTNASHTASTVLRAMLQNIAVSFANSFSIGTDAPAGLDRRFHTGDLVAPVIDNE
jgi:hypothetical protein